MAIQKHMFYKIRKMVLFEGGKRWFVAEGGYLLQLFYFRADFEYYFSKEAGKSIQKLLFSHPELYHVCFKACAYFY